MRWIIIHAHDFSASRDHQGSQALWLGLVTTISGCIAPFFQPMSCVIQERILDTGRVAINQHVYPVTSSQRVIQSTNMPHDLSTKINPDQVDLVHDHELSEK